MIYRLLKWQVKGNPLAICFLESCQQGLENVQFHDHVAEMSDGYGDYVLVIEFYQEEEVEFDTVLSSVPMERWSLRESGYEIASFSRHTLTRRRWYSIQQRLGWAQ